MEVDEILKQRSWSKSEEKKILELCSTIVSLQTELATIYDGVWDHLEKLHEAVAADDRKLLIEQSSASAKGVCRTEIIKQAIYDTKIQLDYYCDPSHPLENASSPKLQKNGILKDGKDVVVPIKEVTIVEPKKKEKEKKEKIKEIKKKENSSSAESSPKERKSSSGRKSDATTVTSDGSDLPRKMSTSKEEKKRIEKEIKEKEKAEKEAAKAKKKADKEKKRKRIRKKRKLIRRKKKLTRKKRK